MPRQLLNSATQKFITTYRNPACIPSMLIAQLQVFQLPTWSSLPWNCHCSQGAHNVPWLCWVMGTVAIRIFCTEWGEAVSWGCSPKSAMSQWGTASKFWAQSRASEARKGDSPSQREKWEFVLGHSQSTCSQAGSPCRSQELGSSSLQSISATSLPI